METISCKVYMRPVFSKTKNGISMLPETTAEQVKEEAVNVNVHPNVLVWFSEHSLVWPEQARFLELEKILFQVKKYVRLAEQARFLELEKILFQVKSECLSVMVFQSSAYGKVFLLDGALQLTEKDECSYQEMMTHLPLCSVLSPKRVLLIGGRDGGILRELSHHSSVEQMDICEIDTMLIDVYKEFLPDVAVGYKDSCVKLHVIDEISAMQLNFKRVLDGSNKEDWTESQNSDLTVANFILATCEKQVLVYFESNILDVPSNTWWVDSGAVLHVTNSLQALKNVRRLSVGMVVQVANGVCVQVEQMGDIFLRMSTGYILKLKNVVYVPSMIRNLISVSALDDDQYTCSFGNSTCELLYNSRVVGSAVLTNGLYKINPDPTFVDSANAMIQPVSQTVQSSSANSLVDPEQLVAMDEDSNESCDEIPVRRSKRVRRSAISND